MKRTSILLAVLVMVLGLSAAAHAALILRGTDSLGNRLIYDTDSNITWYDYMRSVDNWENQVNWAAGLTVNFGGTIFDDWRLPTALNQDGTGPCFRYNCTGSEMGHLYYTELGNPAGGPLSTSFIDGITGDQESFLHLESIFSGFYWSGTSAPEGPNSAWVFGFGNGDQLYGPKDLDLYALAVRPGDVSVVPEPGTMLLLGSGLAGLVAFRKRLRRIHR